MISSTFPGLGSSFSWPWRHPEKSLRSPRCNVSLPEGMDFAGLKGLLTRA